MKRIIDWMSPFTVKREQNRRIWMIDALRGVAIILMTIFHALVDIRDFFGFADVRYFEPPLMYIGRASALLFIFISGVSSRFSRNNIKRGAIVLACGMVVTAATFFAVRDLYIRFGILHFLGSAMIIAGLLERIPAGDKFKQWCLYAAAPLSLLIGRFASRTHSDLPLAFIFGVTATGFASYDYYPLFPWIGVFFAGYAVGYFALANREKLALIKADGIFARPAAALCALGRVSLAYYLLHQPALLAVFFIFDILRRIALNL